MTCDADVYTVTLSCYNTQHKLSPAFTTVTIHLDLHSGFSSSSSSRSATQCSSGQQSRFVIAEHMKNVTLGILRCGNPVYCTSDKPCTHSLLGTLSLNLVRQTQTHL